MSTRATKRRRAVRLVTIALALGLGIWWWRFGPVPTTGAGQPPGRGARWLLQRTYATVPPADEADYTRLDLDHPTGWLSIFAEPVQTLEAYQRGNPTRPTATRGAIIIQPLGPLSAEQKRMLPALREYAQTFFQLPARIAPVLQLDSFKIQTRGSGAADHRGGRQYSARSVIDRILAPRLPPDAVAYFGVTGADLYANQMSFVFGQGDFKRRVGVYSLGRYFPEFWSRKRGADDDKLALRRACQVLNHEIGHMLSLPHCVFYRCSMNGSNSLAESDAAPVEYCPLCHRKLLWNIGFDATRRYESLQAFFQRHGVAEARWYDSRMANWKKVAARESR